MGNFLFLTFHSVKSSNSDQETTNNADNCCSKASSELKLYQAFIFSVPIFFTLILLLLFYWFYLRRRRVNWSSLRMRTPNFLPAYETSDDISRIELGVKKELREMLPVIVFKESFSVKDTQCSVCLGDYRAEDRLQQIPACRHTFHMDCIDLWLATHTTCPLCRHSLLASPKSMCPRAVPDSYVETDNGRASDAPHENGSLAGEDQPAGSGEGDEATYGRDTETDIKYDEVERCMANGTC